VAEAPLLAKPSWIRVRVSQSETFKGVKQTLREQRLHTVCEEASCPNIGECFGKGTATFMVLGELCTRRCPFCDVAHGRPAAPDPQEPLNLALTVARLRLAHVVITSVDRDDLRDGGAGHFVECIRAVRQQSPATRIEVLTPDFRGRHEVAIGLLAACPPDVMNHNLETVPRLYARARPGADYAHSLRLLKTFKQQRPEVLTKSGLMLGLGETDDWAHAGSYAEYLNAAHLADEYLRQIWELMQSMPEYRGKTTLIVLPDHGRGMGVKWTDHGQKVSGGWREREEAPMDRAGARASSFTTPGCGTRRSRAVCAQ